MMPQETWKTMCGVLVDLKDQVDRLDDHWLTEPPGTQQAVTEIEERILDILDLVNSLARDCIWMRGHLDGAAILLKQDDQLVDTLKRALLIAQQPGCPSDVDIPGERPNRQGDTIGAITPNTAPCSEIGQALACRHARDGLTAGRIAHLVKELKLQPAGIVNWWLKDGSKRCSHTYNYSQWLAIRDLAISKGLIDSLEYPVPARLRSEDSDE